MQGYAQKWLRHLKSWKGRRVKSERPAFARLQRAMEELMWELRIHLRQGFGLTGYADVTNEKRTTKTEGEISMPSPSVTNRRLLTAAGWVYASKS